MRPRRSRGDPWLKRIFAGYAFAIDYRDRRGHFYGLFDQEQTRRVTGRQQHLLSVERLARGVMRGCISAGAPAH